MTRFTDGKWFFAYLTGVMGLAFAPAAVRAGNAVAFMTSAVALAYVAVAYALYRTDNHGRGRTYRSRVQHRLARLLVGPTKKCGCWDEAGSDTVESERFVGRDTEGELFIFRARRRELRRCHGCGRHYHVERSEKLRHVADKNALEAYETRDRVVGFPRGVHFWPEDEPDVREHLDAPIEEIAR